MYKQIKKLFKIFTVNDKTKTNNNILLKYLYSYSDLELSKSLKSNQSPASSNNNHTNTATKKVTQDDHVVPNLDANKVTTNNKNNHTNLDGQLVEAASDPNIEATTKTTTTTSKQSEHELPFARQENHEEIDKLSETSSDSGQGQSEMLLASHDFDASDLCLNSADNNSNCSADSKVDRDCLNNSNNSHDYEETPGEITKSDPLVSANQTVPLSNDSFNSIETNYSATSSTSTSKISTSKNAKKSAKNQKSPATNGDKESTNQSAAKKKDSSSTQSKAKVDKKDEASETRLG